MKLSDEQATNVGLLSGILAFVGSAAAIMSLPHSILTPALIGAGLLLTMAGLVSAFLFWNTRRAHGLMLAAGAIPTGLVIAYVLTFNPWHNGDYWVMAAIGLLALAPGQWVGQRVYDRLRPKGDQ